MVCLEEWPTHLLGQVVRIRSVIQHMCVLCVCVPSADRLMIVAQFASIAAGPESEGDDARGVSGGFYLQTGE